MGSQCTVSVMMTAFLVIISSVISSLSSLPANTGECSGEGQICQIPYLYSGQLHFQCSTQAPGGEQDHHGRCPVRLHDQDTREASDQPSDWVVCGASCPLQRYTENNEIENHLADLVEEFPHLANLVEVGNSTLGCCSQASTPSRPTRTFAPTGGVILHSQTVNITITEEN